MYSLGKTNTTILLAGLMSFGGITTSAVHAQEIDYDEVNKRAKEQRGSGALVRSLQKLYARTNISEVFSTQLPKSNELSSEDKMYKPLLKCFRKFARKNKGGAEGPRVLSQIIESIKIEGVISQDSFLIGTAADECDEALRNLDSFKPTPDQIFSSIKSLPDGTSKYFLHKLYGRRPIACESRELTVEAYAWVGGSAGGASVKCLLSDGTIRKYIGLSVGIGLGAGLALTTSRTNMDLDSPYALGAESAKSLYLEQRKVNDRLTIGVISERQSFDERYAEDDQRTGVGLSYELVATKRKLALRFINGKTRWNYLLDQLKK